MGHYTIRDYVENGEIYTLITVFQHKGKNRLQVRATRKFWHKREFGLPFRPESMRRYEQRLQRAGYAWDGCYTTAIYNR